MSLTRLETSIVGRFVKHCSVIVHAVLCWLALVQHSNAEVILACSFPTIPPVVMIYPDGLGSAMMVVDGRPEVEVTSGTGTNRFESAVVDGYLFRFSPSSSHIDIEFEGTLVASEAGRCVRIGGPENPTPLSLAQAPQSTEVETGDWELDVSTSSFDDSQTVVLALSSEDSVPARFGSSMVTPRLILRCLENTTSMYFVIRGTFLADIQGYGQIDYRIDERPASQWSMQASTDNEALGLWRGSRAIPQIRSMFGGQHLTIRLTPFNESPLELNFSIAGLEAAITPLRESCSW